MKRHVLPFALLFVCATPLLAQVWEPKAAGVLPQNVNVFDVSTVGDQIVWAVCGAFASNGPFPGDVPIVLRSTDGGETWSVKTVTGATGRYSWDIHALDANTACITTQDLNTGPGRGIFRTTDGGETWTETLHHVAGGVWVHFFDGSEGVCINARYIGRTFDGGQTWTTTQIPLFQANEGNILNSATTSLATVGNNLWFGTWKGRVFRSTNRGLNWEVFNSGLGASAIFVSMDFLDEQNGLALYSFNNAPLNYHIARTTDGGVTWATLPDTPLNFKEIAAVPCSKTFVATKFWESGPGTSISTDLGQTWTAVDSTHEIWAPVFDSPESGWVALATPTGANPALYKWSGNSLDTRIYVNRAATGANTGASWADAYTDLQAALAAAQAGDEIWVAEGTYTPAAPGGSQMAAFTLNKNLKLYGGFAGTECYLGERDIELYPTILSGDLNGDDVPDDFSTNRGDNVNRVMLINSTVNNNTLLDGFTISGGQADGLSTSGGGILTTGAPVIRRCIFTQNMARTNGGGLYASGINAQGLRVEDCRFENNRATNTLGSAHGGGMYATNVKGAGFDLKGTTFTGNTGDWEGGLSVFNSNAFVDGATFADNFTKRHGGGLRVNYQPGNDNLHFRIQNSTFENNKASFGGGMYCLLQSQYCSIEVINSRFVGNAVEDMQLKGWDQSYGGFGTYITPTGANTSILIDSCYFENNTTTFNHAAVGIETDGNNTAVDMRNSFFLDNTTTIYSATVGIWASIASVFAYIENCRFEKNTSVFSSGLSIGSSKGSFAVRNCNFLDNQAEYGSALTLNGKPGSEVDFIVENCVFEGNNADYGGAVLLAGSSEDFKAIIDRCTIRNNNSPAGSAITAICDNPALFPIATIHPGSVFSNCLIEGNTGGAAIAIDSVRGIRFLNCTVANNQGGIQLSDSGAITLQNTILHNPGYTEYEALTGDVAFNSLGGNLIGDGSLSGQLLPSDKQNLDPLFAAPGDYRLSSGSPCIDMGVNLGNLPVADLAGNLRVAGAAVDIGAYEYGSSSSAGEISAVYLALSPNPAADFVRFQLPDQLPGSIEAMVFDAQGRPVRFRTLQAGQPLEVQDLPPDLYTLRIAAGERVYVGRFVKQ